MATAEDLLEGVRRWRAGDRLGLGDLERFLDDNAAAVARDERAGWLAGEVRAVVAEARQQHPDQPSVAAQLARARLSAQLGPE